ncbi:iron-containing alcohol dehydrogenase [Spartinivicinus ruber]|uniref:iron-containing alcohol dehydrogenase n=1 Tax=Spartinivicinus ruber TaxID=2683272 RepID=UPI001E498756|nr:iron-containing alcohol dehydrogenase [Spartinivicinus ruber]
MEYTSVIEQMPCRWHFPTAILLGVGERQLLPELCLQHDIQSPLVVIDPVLAQLPVFTALIGKIARGGLKLTVFTKISGNPTGQQVMAGVTQFRYHQHDGVIAIGGGSALDTGKAIALMVGQTKSLWDFEDIGDNWKQADADKIVPVVAVPTTAGTGSEVGRAAVITDEKVQLKKIIFHPKMLPCQVLLDPELTLCLPANLTAATGMDALAHNLEAFCAPGYHPMAAGIAVEAIRLIRQYLPRAYVKSEDIEARTHMLVASCMGATAFQRGLGAMHALAHPMGARYNAHHGLLNAILMPYVLMANHAKISGRIVQLAKYINLPQADFAGFMEWVLSLRDRLGIPHTLNAVGVALSDVEELAELAIKDPSAATNPILLSVDEYATLCANAITGTLEFSG